MTDEMEWRVAWRQLATRSIATDICAGVTGHRSWIGATADSVVSSQFSELFFDSVKTDRSPEAPGHPQRRPWERDFQRHPGYSLYLKREVALVVLLPTLLQSIPQDPSEPPASTGSSGSKVIESQGTRSPPHSGHRSGKGG